MIKLSDDKLSNLIERIQSIIDVNDEEIRICALTSLVEELEELKDNKSRREE